MPGILPPRLAYHSCRSGLPVRTSTASSTHNKTENQLLFFSAICTLPAQNGVFNYKESHCFFNTVLFGTYRNHPMPVNAGS